MRPAAYDAEAAIEETHWWFVVRRELFSRLILEFGPAKMDTILDIGTGTGANLRLLRDLGYARIIGIDPNDHAIRHCAAKGLGNVQRADVCDLPFSSGSFRLILATDVIEHVEDDGRAMREIARVLAPGGRVLIAVPAFPSLWGLQDVVSHHQRRYRMLSLLTLLKVADLKPLVQFHFNFLLFAPIWLARTIIRISKPDIDSEGQINTPVLNALLTRVFRWDVRLARYMRPPFGVSILVVAERRT
jgi:SAM-dependent methyltransferase